MLVGHSTGGGEVAHYIGRHGNERVSKVVLIGAVPPVMLKTNSNPNGLPMSVFDGIRVGVASNRSQFYKDLALFDASSVHPIAQFAVIRNLLQSFYFG